MLSSKNFSTNTVVELDYSSSSIYVLLMFIAHGNAKRLTVHMLIEPLAK